MQSGGAIHFQFIEQGPAHGSLIKVL
jgi:hypothetical protein